MSSKTILKHLIFLSYFHSYICYRSSYQSDMCRSKTGHDCSFQMPINVTKNACIIVSVTEECRSYDFSSWNLNSLTIPHSESVAPFIVNLSPFGAITDKLVQAHPISAINITLSISNKDISGFSVILTKDFLGTHICRLFDYRNSLNSLHFPMTFFYDCFRLLVENNLDYVNMTFTAYPLNVELKYYVYIPRIKPIESMCNKLQPLVMIYHGSLKENHVQMKFSPALNYSDFRYYVVILSDFTNKEVKSTKILANNTKEMLFTEFSSVKEGYYFLSINISKEEFSCQVFKSKAFPVKSPPEGYSAIVILVILCIILIAILAAILIYYGCFAAIFPVKSPCDLKLLIIYSPDCDELNSFVLNFMKYIKANYHVSIHSSHGLDRKPTEWLKEEYASSNIIIFVVSEGLFHILQNNNRPPMKVRHHWKEQVQMTMSYIEMMYSKRSTENSKERKKFCIVCFPFSGRNLIPDCLKYIGPLFMLPHDESQFYKYLFDYKSVFPLYRNYKAVQPHLKMKSDNSMENHLNIMMETVSANLHLQYIENDGEDSNNEDMNCSDLFKNKSDISTERNTLLLNKDNNFYLKDESVYHCDKLLINDTAVSEKGDNLHRSDKSFLSSGYNNVINVNHCNTESCSGENPQFLKNNSNELENEDFMDYLVRKYFRKS